MSLFMHKCVDFPPTPIPPLEYQATTELALWIRKQSISPQLVYHQFFFRHFVHSLKFAFLNLRNKNK